MRWSLVSERIQGFAGNRFAIHTLTGLEQRPVPETDEWRSRDETIALPAPRHRPASVRQRVEAMEKLLERLFVIPGTKRTVGLDVVLDLVPVVGDIAAAALGAYIVWEAKNLGMPKWQMARMTGNVGVNWLLGSCRWCPWSAWSPTLLFRSNSKNLKIIKKHLEQASRGQRDDRGRGDEASLAQSTSSRFPHRRGPAVRNGPSPGERRSAARSIGK